MSLKIAKDRDRISRVHTGMARCSMNRTLLTILTILLKLLYKYTMKVSLKNVSNFIYP